MRFERGGAWINADRCGMYVYMYCPYPTGRQESECVDGMLYQQHSFDVES